MGCAAEMVTLAAWGVGRAGASADSASHEDAPNVFRDAAALALGGRSCSIGVLLGNSSSRECHAPTGSDPSMWLALAGGHWRVITHDPRLVASPLPLAAPSSSFPAIQIDGLPRSKTRNACAAITFVTVTHSNTHAPHTPQPPPPPPSSSSSLPPLPPPRACIIGRRGAEGGGRQLHVVWEREHTLLHAAIMHCCSGADDKWCVTQPYWPARAPPPLTLTPVLIVPCFLHSGDM